MQLSAPRRALVAAATLATLGTCTRAREARGEGEIVRRFSSEVSSYADTQHVYVLTPTIAAGLADPTRGWSANGRYLADAISAASVDIVATASPRWSELRHAAAIDGVYKPRDLGANVAASFSREPDYLALTAAGGLVHDFLQKNVTVGLQYAYGHDTIGRAGTPFDVFSRTLARHAIKPTLVLVLDRASLLTVVGDVVVERGDQSKPYRYIPTFAPDVAGAVPRGADVDLVHALRAPERPLEQLPLERDRYAVTARYARRFEGATLRLEERVYADTWGLAATTTDARPIFDLSRRWALWPHLRFHLQNAVSFWRRAYVAEPSIAGPTLLPALRTGDRELGALTNLTLGMGVRWALGGGDRVDTWALRAQLDVTWTSFFDALYVTDRLAAFLAIGVEAAP